MLFRPSPSIPDTTARNDSTALQRTFDSSRAAISLYANLHQSRKINYSWVTLHSVFMAGLSYIYAVRTHFQHARQHQPKSLLQTAPSIIQVVNDTRACSKVLVAVSERWESATRNCAEVLDKLSDAVVTDIVESQTRVSSAQQPSRSTSASASVYHDEEAMADAATPTAAGTAAQVTPASSSAFFGASTHSFIAVNDTQMQYHLGAQQHSDDMFNMTVDNTLRDCYVDIQNLFHDQSQNDAIARLSQDWLFGIEEESHGHRRS
jgi:hypothetical protein